MPVISLLLIFALAYMLGILKLRRRTRRNYLPAPSRTVAMIGGLLVVYIALASPLDDVADKMLSAHMIQHLLLMLAAAPLLVWGRPMPYWIWSLPRALRKIAGLLWTKSGLSEVVRALRRPAATWSVFCGMVFLWHVPAIYRWANAGEVRHSLMHLSFLGSGLLFWSVVMEPAGRRRLSYASSALFVFSAALITGLLGALIAFSRQPVYAVPYYSPIPFGLTALADQQLAGLIMWIPMDLILFGVALALFAATVAEANRGGNRTQSDESCHDTSGC
jgi:putative membrane protein